MRQTQFRRFRGPIKLKPQPKANGRPRLLPAAGGTVTFCGVTLDYDQFWERAATLRSARSREILDRLRDGASYEEIARQRGCDVKSIRTQLHRARCHIFAIASGLVDHEDMEQEAAHG